MADKEFIVSHAHARSPLTIRGKNLKEALESEELDPAIWKEVKPSEPEESPPESHLDNLDVAP